jgi:hypothetical protein
MGLLFPERVVPLDTVTGHCEQCGREREQNLFLVYGYTGLLLIFNRVIYQKYVVVCDVCGAEYEGNPDVMSKEYPPDKCIPVLDRYGTFFLLLIAALAFVFVGIASQAFRF